MKLYILAWVVALFFAMNIGASGTAASMGAAYGGGAIHRRFVALALVAGAVFLGAYLGGGNVVKTISGGIIPQHLITLQLTVLIITGAVITLFLATLLGIPLSTSEVTVGSLVGVGLAYHAIYFQKVLFLLGVWFALPFIAYGISFAIGRGIRWAKLRFPSHGKVHHRRVAVLLTVFLIGAGCYEAFSAGMNNVANAIGPLVAAGVVSVKTGLFFGALFVAVGALLLGGRVLETNAKKIARLSLLDGSVASLTSGTLVIVASLFGLPVPLTQASTMSIMGVGSAKTGMGLWKQGIVKRVMLVWITSPLSSLVISYVLVRIFARSDLYAVAPIVCAIAMTAGAFLLLHRKSGNKSVVISASYETSKKDTSAGKRSVL